MPVIIERTAGPRSCKLNRAGVTHVISSTKGTVPLVRDNYDGPVFDANLLGMNPVWPALKDHGNAYAYVFIATYEDNVDNGWNPTFDTERIICRGPYLIKGTEREWHALGHLQQRDFVASTNQRFFIEGQEFQGLVEEAQVWQVARGYVREIDRNLLKSNSANGEL